MPTAEEMAKRDMDSLKVVLNLTEDQIPFIQKVLDNSYNKMQKLFQSDPPDFMQMGKIMEDRDNDILTVLTEEQAAKYKDYREKQKAEIQTGRPGQLTNLNFRIKKLHRKNQIEVFFCSYSFNNISLFGLFTG